MDGLSLLGYTVCFPEVGLRLSDSGDGGGVETAVGFGVGAEVLSLGELEVLVVDCSVGELLSNLNGITVLDGKGVEIELSFVSSEDGMNEESIDDTMLGSRVSVGSNVLDISVLDG